MYMLISRNSCLTHALLCRIYRRLICPTDKNASAELVSGAGGRRSSTAAQRFVRVWGSSGSVACFICRKRCDLARRWLRSGASRHPTSATRFACIGVTSKLAAHQRSFSGAGGGRSSTAQRPRRRRRQHTTLFVRVGGSSGFCCVFHLRGTEPATVDGWGRGIHRAQCGGKNCK